MPRSLHLAPACLACSVPLDGPLAVVARLSGVRRSSSHPNLCNRCRSHLIAGQISDVSVLQLQLNRCFSLGQRPIPDTETEVRALLGRLRNLAESLGAFVPPHQADSASRLELRAFFNLPIPIKEPAPRAVTVAQALMRELRDEAKTLGLQLPASAAITSGYGELLEASDPCESYPLSPCVEQLPDLLAKAPDHTILVDQPTQALLDPALLVNAADEVSVVSADRLPAFALRDLRPGSSRFGGTITQLLGLVAALLAIPCVAMVVVSPVSILLGLGSVFAALLPFYKVIGMGFWPRVLLSVTAILVSSINLIEVEARLAKLRRLQREVGVRLRLPRQQRRRVRLLRWSSALVLVLVLAEGLLRTLVMKMPLF